MRLALQHGKSVSRHQPRNPLSSLLYLTSRQVPRFVQTSPFQSQLSLPLTPAASMSTMNLTKSAFLLVNVSDLSFDQEHMDNGFIFRLFLTVDLPGNKVQHFDKGSRFNGYLCKHIKSLDDMSCLRSRVAFVIIKRHHSCAAQCCTWMQMVFMKD